MHHGIQKFNQLKQNKQTIENDINDEKFLFKNKIDKKKFKNENVTLNTMASSKVKISIPNSKSTILKTSDKTPRDNYYTLETKLPEDKTISIQPTSSLRSIHQLPASNRILKLNIVHPNKNSILSKFRDEMETQKEIIEIELEKSMAIKFKHSDIYKKMKRKEQAEKEFKKKLAENKLLKKQSTKRGSNQILPIVDFENDQNVCSNISAIFKTDLFLDEKKRNTTSDFNNSLTPMEPMRSSKKKNWLSLTVGLKKIDKMVEQSEKNTSNNMVIERKEEDSHSNKQIINIHTEITKVKHKETPKKIPKVVSSRKKVFTVDYVDKWYEKVGFPTLQYSSKLLNSVDYQSSLIIDEIKVLLDNLQFFKINFLQGIDLLPVFQNMDLRLQIKLNKVLEETCGLLMEIPKIILLDFSKYLERFVTIKPPAPERFKTREAKSEDSSFSSNCRLLSDVSLFFKSCFEIYTTLVKQVEDMLVTNNLFQKLMQFLARARYNISNLIMTLKNATINMNNDQKNLQKFQLIWDKDTLRDEEIEINSNNQNKKQILPKIKNTKFKKKRVDLTEKIRSQFIFKSNEENQRINRINKVLNDRLKESEDSFEIKKKFNRKKDYISPLNSDVMTKLLKYCPKDVKEYIISERTVERYRIQNRNTFEQDSD